MEEGIRSLDEFFNEHPVVVPFDKRIVDLAIVFIQHEGKTLHGHNKVPPAFPKPLPKISITKLLPIWHCTFLSNINEPDLFALLSCATYLEAEKLATVVSVKIALKMQRCENTAALRRFLGVTNDFTP